MLRSMVIALGLYASGALAEDGYCAKLLAAGPKDLAGQLALHPQLVEEGCAHEAGALRLRLQTELEAQITQGTVGQRSTAMAQLRALDAEHPVVALADARAAFESEQWEKAKTSADTAIARLMNASGAEAKKQLDEAAQIRRNAMQLSPTYLPTASSRSRGICDFSSTRSGGVALSLMAEPIEFEFGSADFTPKGQQAASALAGWFKQGCLKESATLVGHTDPVGTAADNCALAERRVQAVKQFLQQQQISQHIQVVALGEGAPRQDLPAGLSKDQNHQLLRRVEFLEIAAGESLPVCDPNLESSVN